MRSSEHRHGISTHRLLFAGSAGGGGGAGGRRRQPATDRDCQCQLREEQRENHLGSDREGGESAGEGSRSRQHGGSRSTPDPRDAQIAKMRRQVAEQNAQMAAMQQTLERMQGV